MGDKSIEAIDDTDRKQGDIGSKLRFEVEDEVHYVISLSAMETLLMMSSGAARVSGNVAEMILWFK